VTVEFEEKLTPLPYRIALLPGDGIGPEVTSESVRLIQAIAKIDPGLTFDVEILPWNAEYYLENGSMMPPDGLQQLREFDAIFLGAVGDKRVPDHIALRQLIFAIRQGFDQYVNLRPVRLLRGAHTPLVGKTNSDINMVFVRENSEGEYSGLGQTESAGSADEVAYQTSVFSRKGVERVMRFAFEMARAQGKSLQSISKGNALNYSGVLWDQIFAEIRTQYQDVEAENLLVDAAAFHMVRTPERFGVVVASNLFGDILTDLGAALAGGLGFAASANLCPDKRFPSMFEPVHGSAPDIAGRHVANPMASFWAIGMMMTDLGYPKWERRIISAIEKVLVDGLVGTPDLGGTSKSREVTDAVIEALQTVDSSKV
jgi:tartrate dehydrogenase/decarboxylase/D-malate dehydrogenase